MFIHMPQQSGPFPLSRHVLHDEASKDFQARTLLSSRRPPHLKSVEHKRIAPVWNQGEIGQCTAEAALGLLMTEPLHKPEFNYNGTGPDADTLALYREETRLDNRDIPGSWEPEDTGSTGLWSMKALHQRGTIRGYRWAFSLMTVLQLLQEMPVSTGTAWYPSMFEPDERGLLAVDRSVAPAGGHQYDLIGVDMETEEVIGMNSWDTTWGDNGKFRMSFADYGALLADNGDAVVPEV